MADFFETELLECSFRGIGFPVTSLRVHIKQSTSVHAKPDQDGARIESTGRDPITFDAQIPFYNSLSKGKNETWGTPYPDGHRAFLSAMADRSAGNFQHPSLGLIVVKPVSCETALDASRRDGETVSASWIEHSLSEDASNAVLGQASPISVATLNAIDLDTRLDNTQFGGFDPDAGGLSFEESMRRIAGVVDTASLLSRRAFGMIGRVVYRVDAIAFAVVSLQNNQNWELKQALARLRSSVLDVKRATLAAQKDVRIFIAPGPTTLANLAAKLRNKVGDMIALNPQLVSSPQVPARTVVRYYQSINP